MLLNQKHRKRLGIVWGIVSVIMVLGMIALYFPALWSK
jgi:hypothetical protein